MESLFDLEESLRLKGLGMEAAAAKREVTLKTARAVAVALGKQQGEVTADDVNWHLENLGINPEELGPAAGSIFRGACWRFTGARVKSARKKNHARELKVWKYIGG